MLNDDLPNVTFVDNQLEGRAQLSCISKRRNDIANTLKGGKPDAADATPNAAQWRGLTARQKRIMPPRQKLLLSAFDKDLDRMSGKRSVKG